MRVLRDALSKQYWRRSPDVLDPRIAVATLRKMLDEQKLLKRATRWTDKNCSAWTESERLAAENLCQRRIEALELAVDILSLLI